MRRASIHISVLPALLLLCLGTPPTTAQESSRLDQVLDRVFAQEQGMLERLMDHHPLVETYLQSVKPNGVEGLTPISDRYFLGRLQRFDKKKKSGEQLVDLYHYSVTANPDGFARMLTLDAADFQRKNYDVRFVRREFLGEIRTFVFDVVPKTVKGAKPGRFSGRIWVEDRDYHIVRYNGVYGSIFRTNLHFDSWRVNVEPGVWLPAYVYTEEPDRPGGDPKIKHMGQTRIWGYDVGEQRFDQEFAKVLIDAPLTSDESEQPGQISPVESFRAWEREAENNVLRRLTRAGMLAPEGGITEVLETVVANLEVTNELDIYPPVRCRVLLTTPLESFTAGHTIVVSRGLIDVLPDEGALALVLARELAHIVSGHRVDTKYAFSDQMLVADKEVLELFSFAHDEAQERQADLRAIELLQNSPYKDQLAGAGLFLKTLADRSNRLTTLNEPHFGNRVATRDQLSRLQPILDAAPEIDATALDQIAALPLGGRVKVDPWSAKTELMKTGSVAPMSAREKLPFQITPLMPYLIRHRGTAATATVTTTNNTEPLNAEAR
ncbi:MAG: M48 family metalloprotease [Acidobacteria bacterium]|nr:M48 family metalloprotease [Acidobacteriota bacterium]NIM60124.1 M48 family metalloprotease [Acidobacteriota bacterium]NIO57793.1 M48 family metalloprotease [Acidobacteriota bacterium]NIQ28802.1 M48 family metalloprotease [Acidobacteriota bacterium]NIQ83260.1 M48 family metalloprotease [Acidobacteriota bacterium]